jgi:hypothetical protein
MPLVDSGSAGFEATARVSRGLERKQINVVRVMRLHWLTCVTRTEVQSKWRVLPSYGRRGHQH